jgi:hypothetical protein
MNDLLHILLGAALVSTGVFASALADRIRGLRIERRQAPQPRQALQPYESSWPIPAKARGAIAPTARDTTDVADVIAALCAAGYLKSVATAAAQRCTAAERTSIELWVRAALRNCAHGVLS